jgi:cytochrome c5
LEQAMSDAEETAFREMFPIVIAGLAGLAVVFLVAALVVGQDTEDTYVPSGMTEAEAVAKRTEPIGQVNMGGPKVAEAEQAESGADDEPRGGETVYNAVCSACHDAGTLGAPELGDKAAWSERVQKGLETLVDHSYNGFNQMPAQKGAASRDEIERAIEYMLDEVGVEP